MATTDADEIDVADTGFAAAALRLLGSRRCGDGQASATKRSCSASTACALPRRLISLPNGFRKSGPVGQYTSSLLPSGSRK